MHAHIQDLKSLLLSNENEVPRRWERDFSRRFPLLKVASFSICEKLYNKAQMRCTN